MKEFVIIEVGSTNTKAYFCKGNEVQDLGFKTIEFKNHYKIEKQINEGDKQELFKYIKEFKNENIYVFGTSIFRNLSPSEKDDWLKEFKRVIGLDFHIVSPDEENEYTVYGAVSNIHYDGNIGVVIGGGGSTELSIVSNGKIIEALNYPFGAMDVCDKYPDLREDYAKTDYNKMIKETMSTMQKPKNKADILILAGGDYIYFYEELKYPVNKNEFYDDKLQPYSLEVTIMDELDKDFFYSKSLDEICKRTNNEGWWRGARGMRICIKAVVEMLDAKYIIPTRISMVYGIAEAIKSGKFAK